MKSEIGEVYFYKNGERRKQKIYISKNEEKFLKELPDGIYNPYADKESQNLSEMIDIEKSYSQYINEDISVLRCCKNILVSKGQIEILNNYSLQCCIANKIDNMTSKILSNDFINAASHSLVENSYFKVLQKENDFVYYDYQFKNPKETIEYFLKEKTNSLTEKEKIMFEKYRKFNLSELLFGDFKNNLVTHYNGGVIIIANDHTFKSTCKGYQHNYEFNTYFMNHDNSVNVNDMNIFQMVNSTNFIMIQILKNELVIWLPTNINLYQLEELEKLILEIEKFENLEITGYKINDLNNPLKSIEDFNNYIEIEKNNKMKR